MNIRNTLLIVICFSASAAFGMERPTGPQDPNTIKERAEHFQGKPTTIIHIQNGKWNGQRYVEINRKLYPASQAAAAATLQSMHTHHRHDRDARPSKSILKKTSPNQNPKN